MNRKFLLKGMVFALVGLIVGGFLQQKDAAAYWTDDNGEQCFAIQYVKEEKHNDPTGVKQYRWVTTTYSTRQICAKVADGKVQGNLYDKSKPSNSKSSNFPMLELDSKKSNVVNLLSCPENKTGCSSVQAITTPFALSSVNSFEELAQKVWSAAQDNYNNKEDIKKEELGINTNNTKAAQDAQKKYEEQADNTGANMGAGDGGTSEVAEKCENMGGAQSLGWIVCPILTWMGEASSDLYNKYVEPSLQIDPKLFTDDYSDVAGAWGTFQNIANIIFVILLLIVIFSQLTGVGIDNYGIKRILPKLIVVAILINLSYAVCIVAVDLSNILGNGFQALFDGLGETLKVAMNDSINIEGTNVDISSASGTLASVGVLSSVVIATGAMWKNPAIPLSLLVSALGVLISIIFLFILLSAREAAIVILTVISPVAIVCYALPNTKKVFDRWLKIFEGLLLVYPIAGLLVGGGNYVARLLLTAGFAQAGFISAFTAMIAGIVPIFFIPSVLKSSFAAMGNLGARISGFGDRLGSGVTRGIRSTEGYKSLQKAGYARKTRINAGLDSKGNPTRSWRNALANTGFGRAIGYQNLQGARIKAARANAAENVESGAALGELAYQRYKQAHPEESDDAYYERLLREAAASGNQNRIMTALAQMNGSNMQESHKANVARSVLGTRANFGNMDAAQIRNTLENVGKQYGNGFLRKDFEFKNYAMRGGVGSAGAQDVDGWARNNLAADDLKDDDVADSSTERRAELMNDGIITSAQSQRVWASDANLDTGARLQLGAHGNAGMVMSKGEIQAALDPKSAVGPSRLTREQITAYTEAAPQDTVIRDVRWKDKQGQHQQTDTLEVHHNPTSTPPRP